MGQTASSPITPQTIPDLFTIHSVYEEKDTSQIKIYKFNKSGIYHVNGDNVFAYIGDGFYMADKTREGKLICTDADFPVKCFSVEELFNHENLLYVKIYSYSSSYVFAINLETRGISCLCETNVYLNSEHHYKNNKFIQIHNRELFVDELFIGDTCVMSSILDDKIKYDVYDIKNPIRMGGFKILDNCIVLCRGNILYLYNKAQRKFVFSYLFRSKLYRTYTSSNSNNFQFGNELVYIKEN